MLVVSRKKNEKIIIADGVIEICVIDIRGDKVRLGINAPKEIPVHRQEVFEAIQRVGEKRNGGKKPKFQPVADGSVTNNDAAESICDGHAEAHPAAQE